MARLTMPGYAARIERAMVITVEGYDWNCPQHITPRFTREEIEHGIAPLRDALASSGPAASVQTLGDGPLALRVAGIRQLTARVRAYELHAEDGADLPPVSAGAHIDVPVRLRNGVVSTRRYSIASNPTRRDHYEIAVLREAQGSGGSAAMHSDLQLGTVWRCSLPGNDFALHDDARPAVLVAGGIGITPIKAMAEQLQAAGRDVQLHYAVRSLGEAPYLGALQRALGDDLQVYAADRQQRLGVSKLIAQSAPGTVFYVCGPGRLIDAVHDAASAAGLPADRVRSERFAAAASTATNRPLTVTLRRSARRIAVAADQTILDAVEAAGVAAPSGCRAGQCGTCQVKVLAGQPEHRDTALSNAERGAAGLMCICVSRATTSDLTLDL